MAVIGDTQMKDFAEMEKGDSKVSKDHNLSGLMEGEVRMGFIRKVYGIVCAQVTLTALVCALCMWEPVRHKLLYAVISQPHVFMLCMIIGSTLSMIALNMNKKNVPTNLYILALFTIMMAFNTGVGCAIAEEMELGHLVLQAASLTACITIGLTVYVWNCKEDLSWIGAAIYPLLIGMLFFNTLSLFFPSMRMGWVALAASAFSAMIFCMYIVYDTWRILNELQPDDYVEGSIQLYLDIINLFMEILRFLMELQKEDSKDNKD
eukprot:TRINITY_DN8547_c0_g1_i1.p1 TRINITY_DN8547_c0_g1~~TRINITY_DN8547_c0_g1_i1.p1  ORF type:complete len:289 (+),score=46.44 TRINITY_DN8547_c0_g1_i1:81-869(+)